MPLPPHLVPVPPPAAPAPRVKGHLCPLLLQMPMAPQCASWVPGLGTQWPMESVPRDHRDCIWEKMKQGGSRVLGGCFRGREWGQVAERTGTCDQAQAGGGAGEQECVQCGAAWPLSGR